MAGGGYIKSLGDQEEEAATTSQFSTTDGPTAVLNLEVRQPIYNFSYAPRVRQAEEQVRLGRARLTAVVQQDVLLRASIAYLDLVRAEASLRCGADYEELLREVLIDAPSIRRGPRQEFLGRTGRVAAVGGNRATRSGSGSGGVGAR